MAARKKSTSEVVADEQPRDFTGFFAEEPPPLVEPVAASFADHIVPGTQQETVADTPRVAHVASIDTLTRWTLDGPIWAHDNARSRQAVGPAALTREVEQAARPLHVLTRERRPSSEPRAADPVQPTITKIQLHTRAHVLGIQGTSDAILVGDVIESIEPDMLGPIAGFVVRPRRGAPIFMPASSVLAVTVA